MPGMYYYPGFYWDPTYILILIGALLSMWASSRVNATFAKYDRVRNLRGLTGAQAAEAILHQAGIYNVSVQRISGKLTDHYDPSAKVLRLSDSVFGSTSVAAVSVAAHECGHAIQDQKDYADSACACLQFRKYDQLADDYYRYFSWMEYDVDTDWNPSFFSGGFISDCDTAGGI